MSVEYDAYLSEHIANVQKALRWMADTIVLSEISLMSWSMAIANAQRHDESKNSRDEYNAYDRYFYGGNKTSLVQEEFDRAWLHHQKVNPHHWQYWVLINDDDGKNKALQMPVCYVLEMIADWWSFSWKNEDLMEIFKWYKDHEKKMVLHDETRKLVEKILNQMHKILTIREGHSDEDETEDVIEHSDKDDDDKEYGVPEQKKFPLPDADHVRSAIRFFNYVDPKYEQELADAINEKIAEYEMEGIHVGDENRFKKYVKEKYLEHHGILGQKWRQRNGPPYPLDAKGKLKNINKLNDEMNSTWDYGVLHNGNHILDTENFNWGEDYRTIPIETLEKEKIGTCWDFVNYQHNALKNMGINDESFMFVLQKSDDPDDIVTHTFTTFDLDDKKYWMESAAWPKRGVHEIEDYLDVANELNDMYGNPGKGMSIFKYDPEGMDKGLTDVEFFEKATQNLVYDKPEHLEHHGVMGQKWGIQNGPPYPLNRNALDSYDKEKITESSINKYKDQAKQLSHVRVNKGTNGTIFTDDGKLIGMINVETKNDGHRWIQGLELFGDGKGKGLSYDLLDYATDELGATHLSVNKANTVAKHVYDKYGFETYDETDDMYFMKIDYDKD